MVWIVCAYSLPLSTTVTSTSPSSRRQDTRKQMETINRHDAICPCRPPPPPGVLKTSPAQAALDPSPTPPTGCLWAHLGSEGEMAGSEPAGEPETDRARPRSDCCGDRCYKWGRGKEGTGIRGRGQDEGRSCAWQRGRTGHSDQCHCAALARFELGCLLLTICTHPTGFQPH